MEQRAAEVARAARSLGLQGGRDDDGHGHTEAGPPPVETSLPNGLSSKS